MPKWMVHNVSFFIVDILLYIFYSKLHLFVGVEHLLRDVKDTTISTLATEVYFFTNISAVLHFCLKFCF